MIFLYNNGTFASNFFLSMDPLSGLYENRAVDYLYTASWICSENGLMQRKIFFSNALESTSALYKIFPLQ